VIDKIIVVSDCGKVRKKESQHCAQFFNIKNIEFWNFPDGQLQENILNIFTRLLQTIHEGDTVFVPGYTETHPDHIAVEEAVMYASRDILFRYVYYIVSADNLPGSTIVLIPYGAKMSLFKELFPSQYEALHKTKFTFLTYEAYE
jgi:LmbE family N-acetylglucosaminyl deacetylase